ncbi:hypothetical protein EJ07DRAFT_55983, partial [Lizonia empirigonia]
PPAHNPPDKYTSLQSTALSFIAAQSAHAHLASRIDYARLRRLAAPSFTHTFGPRFAVARTPLLQGALSIDAFVAHLGAMEPRLEGWDMEVGKCVVDEQSESVVVRVAYGMRVRGETVLHDVVWWLELEEGEGEGEGEAWLVKRSMEIVDAAAAGRIREVMMG